MGALGVNSIKSDTIWYDKSIFVMSQHVWSNSWDPEGKAHVPPIHRPLTSRCSPQLWWAPFDLYVADIPGPVLEIACSNPTGNTPQILSQHIQSYFHHFHKWWLLSYPSHLSTLSSPCHHPYPSGPLSQFHGWNPRVSTAPGHTPLSYHYRCRRRGVKGSQSSPA